MAIRIYAIKSYQQYLEKLSTVRKAAADFTLDNSFSNEAHVIIARQYEEDIEKLSRKVQEYRDLIETIVAEESQEEEIHLMEYLHTIRCKDQIIDKLKEDGGNV